MRLFCGGGRIGRGGVAYRHSCNREVSGAHDLLLLHAGVRANLVSIKRVVRFLIHAR